MKEHYERIHSESRKVSYFDCFVCEKVFLNRNVRDQHVSTHFSSVLDKVMDNVENLLCSSQGI